MSEIYGSWASRRKNIVEMGTLTAVGSTSAFEVSGNNLTMVHKIVGNNVKIKDEGSLNGTDWFDLDAEKVYGQSGVDAHFYPNRIVRYVRSTMTLSGVGESATISMACD
jgi:hypothetical protein